MDTTRFAESIEAYEKTNPSVDVRIGDQVLRYLTPNKRCLWRVQTLSSKEPSTINWLNTFPDGDTFLDVGANIGVYSIYVGVLRNARIYAFEPEAQNYSLLCKNLMSNSLSERSVAWCAALSDEIKFDKIYLSDLSVGGSCHSFGEQVDANLAPNKFQFNQGCFATTIDQIVADGTMDLPTYIKIDVDGFEHKVIKGAAQTLRNPLVQSLLIEINSNLSEHMWIIEFLASLGFGHDPQQFMGTQRKEGPFKGAGECIFRR